MSITRAELEKAVKEYREYKRIEDEAKKKAEESATIIKNFLAENDVNEYSTVDAKITYSQRTRNDWNKDMLADLLGDKVNDYKKSSSYMVLNVR